MENDVSYFRRRASEEREAAIQAPHPTARQAHIDLVARYEDLATAIEARERHLSLDLVGAECEGPGFVKDPQEGERVGFHPALESSIRWNA